MKSKDTVPTMTFNKFPDYVPKDDDAYLDFTMKALDWQEYMKQKLEELFEAKPTLRNSETKWLAWYWRISDVLKEVLESLK